MSRRVYTPNKATAPLEEAKKQLYLLKTAIQTETEQKIGERIDKIRALLMEVSSEMSS